ncbi:MAG: hypothetical protein QNL04_04735 [SAR324 cluster bacterium]|nr:hypothetical protein [SAR324 cluster bacterium]
MLSFSKFKKPDPLSPYAFNLRKKLLRGNELGHLLDLHSEHQDFLKELEPKLTFHRLPLKERFAYRFLKEVNVLRSDFKEKKNPGQGVFHDLDEVIVNVARNWFPHMDPLPKVTWLKHFTTRKLAHYHFEKDEIAISLIFDSLQAPRELIHYLAYHELLHKEVGVVQKNGKRYAHTSDFKRLEERYPNFAEIDKKITLFLRSA